jgi:MSHA biogenesis protein MshP
MNKATQALRRHRALRPARGFGAVAAIIILVLLAALAAAIVRLGWTQQINSASDLAGANALQAAGAGVEWGIYQALVTGGSFNGCSNSSQTLDLRSTMGVWVTVTCNSTSYVEGAAADGSPRQVRTYVIDAYACNGTATCPDNTKSSSPLYVERRRQAIVTDKLTTDQ